ncbi:type IV secretory system conjugative DNA transfer family protein [Microbacterium schleiferi]|uniref:type IV secretory system conjugative DNA transfer family protein n=1 Tax=Microbacterium schleiferi TaxID=69362 RepID=UPI001D176FFA|nr:hypothetical protein [Microbacterium schleiferi]MCC4267331.1 hypothetical protein [Microbacterium schleiferi]
MPDLHFARLHIPRPLESDAVTALLTRLMSSDVPRPLVFEIHASADGIVHLVGCASAATARLKRLLAAHLPGLAVEAATRPDVAAVSRVVAHPAVLPLAEVDLERVTSGIYDALAARRDDEHLALQLVLGRTRRARGISVKAPDPLQSVASRMLDGVRSIDAETRRRLQNRAGTPTTATTLRIGVTASTQKRIGALVWEVFGALQLLESPRLRLSLNHDTADRWATGSPRAAFDLSAEELAPLLGWPVGDRDYAGLAAIHPRRLPVPEIVTSTQSVFATSTAPGPQRDIGIDPQSRLQHIVAIGPTGSGKSGLFEHLVLSDIESGRACVVVEPKAQLIDNILDRIPMEHADRVVVLDAADEFPVGFNPLDVGDRDADIVVDGIVAALAAIFDDGWGPRTEYLIHGALLSLARAGAHAVDPYTLIDLPRLLTDPTYRRPVVAAVQGDEALASFWAEFEELGAAQRAAMLAAPLNKLRKILLRAPLVRVLGQARPRFRLRDVFRERSVVLVPLNEALIGVGAAKLLGSLIVAEIWNATLERAKEKHPTTRPGMVFVDEVQNYLHLPTSIADALATSRSYGVAWHVAHQYRAQLPPPTRAGLDTNARTKLCFAVGPDDARDLARMAPQLSAEDFQTLPRFEIYAHLIAGGVPAGWCSARTLSPRPSLGTGEQVRQRSRDRYGALPPAPTPVSPSEDREPNRRPSNQKARRS